jgi:hypothetical protein
MDTPQKSITEWIATTRTAQGLTGTVSLDPALHARTLGAVDRVAAGKHVETPFKEVPRREHPTGLLFGEVQFICRPHSRRRLQGALRDHF